MHQPPTCPSTFVAVKMGRGGFSAGAAKKSWAAKKSAKKVQKGKHAGTGGMKLKVVEEWNHLSKKLLKAYPGKSGSMVKTQEMSVKKFFRKKSFKTAMTAETTELYARPMMGVNLACATMEVGLEALWAATAEPEKTGIPQCQALLPAPVLDMVKELQVNRGEDKKAMKKVAKKFVEYLADDEVDEKLEALALLADSSSRMWGLAVSASQLLVAGSKGKDWAKNVAAVSKQPSCVKKWCKDPTDSNLAAAIAGALVEKAHWGGKTRERRQLGAAASSGSDPDSDDDSSSGSADSDADSDDSDKKKKSGKKNAKKRKAASSSDSDSDDKKKKKAKKSKSSSSSSESEDKKSKKKKKSGKDGKKAKKPKKTDSSSDDDDEKKAARVAEEVHERLLAGELAVALTVWDEGAAQVFLSAAHSVLGRLGDKDNKPTLEELCELAALMPDTVATATRIATVKKEIGDLKQFPARFQANRLLQRLAGAAENALTFWAKQQAPSSGAGTGEAAAVAAEKKDD